MRRIVVVGAGQAGLQLALGLRQHGYEVTVISERPGAAIRAGRVLSNQCVFEPALRHERALGLNFWDDQVPPVTGVAFTAAGPAGTMTPAISWQAALRHPAQSVDQRIKMSDWLAEFSRIGGEVRIAKAGPQDLEHCAREFDLVLVAAGRGPQFAGLFARNAAESPFSAPQRAISLINLRIRGGGQFDGYPGVTFGLAEPGEFFALPVLSETGPTLGVYLSGTLGGPLDRWGGVTDADQHLELAEQATRSYFPWLAPMLRDTEPNGPLDVLSGRVTPVVRDPVGTLDSGARVLAVGDTVVTNDPIAGQGANLAAHCAAVYLQAILEHGDRPFDEEFMRRAFGRFWQQARPATRFSNDLLRPPPPHVLATLNTAQTVPEVACRFAELFNDPADYPGWLTDADTALRYLAEATARAS